MSMQTVIPYQGGLPANGDNVLFNSVTAFPPGGSLHLLMQKWFIVTVSADTGTTNAIRAEYSLAGRNTVEADWVTFHQSPALDLTGGSLATYSEEIFIAQYPDVRIVFASNGDQTTFQCTMALAPEKSSSATGNNSTQSKLAGAAVTDT